MVILIFIIFESVCSFQEEIYASVQYSGYGFVKGINVTGKSTKNSTILIPKDKKLNLSSKRDEIRKLHQGTKLFFGIITSPGADNRRTLMERMWLKKAAMLGHKYIYACDEHIEQPYIIPNSRDFNYSTPGYTQFRYRNTYMADKDRELKRLSLAKYFMEKTNADFFINPTDDVFLDIEKINEWAEELASKYDPIKDVKVLGNCLYYYPYQYLQGGSGYIFTRRAAGIFVANGARWLRETRLADDLESARFLQYMNLKPSDGSTQYMIGHGLEMLRFRNFNEEELSKCPTNFFEPVCNQGLMPFENAMMMHYSKIEDGIIAWENFIKLKRSGKKYMWYNKWPHNYMCKM